MDSDLENQVAVWYSQEQQIKELNNQLAVLRVQRAASRDSICGLLNAADGTGPSIQIGEKRLKVVTTRQSMPLSLRYVEACLNACNVEESKVTEIMATLRENRKTRENTDLRLS